MTDALSRIGRRDLLRLGLAAGPASLDVRVGRRAAGGVETPSDQPGE